MREIAELNAKINLLLAMNSVSDAELSRRDEEVARLNGMLALRDEEVARLHREIALRDMELARLDEKQTQQTERLQQLGEEHTQLRQELASKEKALALRTREAAELGNRLAALSRLVEDTRLADEALRSSPSWRLTAPLRSAIALLKK